jgi:hypothetical protein
LIGSGVGGRGPCEAQPTNQDDCRRFCLQGEKDLECAEESSMLPGGTPKDENADSPF